MSRPLYETQKNRDSAYEAAKEIEHKTSAKVEMGPPMAHWDFIIHVKNKPVAIADFKQRHNLREKYKTYFVSEKRIQNLLAESIERALKPVLFVRWTDGLHWLEIAPNAHVDRTVGGRYDRGDSADVEYMLHYWSKDFQRV